jgi:hydroxyacylglutathione hydrolase
VNPEEGMVEVEIIATEELGDRSYVAHDDRTAVVVDPQRDIDRVQRLLGERSLTVAMVCETHRHNDYVTGGFALAQATGATYVVPAEEDIVAGRRGVADGDELAAGSLRVRVMTTPGHTPGHCAYVIDEGGNAGAPAAFTGGSLLYGSVGRTDLSGAARTEELTRAQYRSVRRVAAALPGDTAIYPTHGFGSFCSAGAATGGYASTLSQERARNDALTAGDEDGYVARLVASLDAYPAYYTHMGALNRQGPAAPDLSPPEEADGEQVRKRIAAGEWVVDLRSRRAFAAGHVDGAIGVELAQPFATYLGWLIPWGTPLTLIGENPGQVAWAQRQLVRIGIDRLAGATTRPIGQLADGPLRSCPVATFADLAAARARGEDPAVLDVRTRTEWNRDHIRGAAHVPLYELTASLGRLPSVPLWVHCGSGYRASIAASLLDRAGRKVVLIDDDYSNAAPAGLQLTTDER